MIQFDLTYRDNFGGREARIRFSRTLEQIKRGISDALDPSVFDYDFRIGLQASWADRVLVATVERGDGEHSDRHDYAIPVIGKEELVSTVTEEVVSIVDYLEQA